MLIHMWLIHVLNLMTQLLMSFVSTGLLLEIPPCGGLHPSIPVTPPVTSLTLAWTTGWIHRSTSSSTMTRATLISSYTTRRYPARWRSEAWIRPRRVSAHIYSMVIAARAGARDGDSHPNQEVKVVWIVFAQRQQLEVVIFAVLLNW